MALRGEHFEEYREETAEAVGKLRIGDLYSNLLERPYHLSVSVK